MRVLILVHADLVPPDHAAKVPAKCKTEAQVLRCLKHLGHEVQVVGIYDSLTPLMRNLEQWQPQVVFNLLEEFAGRADFEAHVASYLEMQGVAHTGCNAKGLQLAKDKAITKVLLRHHGLQTPSFVVVRKGQRFSVSRMQLRFPLIVKALNEEASMGIGRMNVVSTEHQLRLQIERMHKAINADALIEEYIDGRELYLGLIGNKRLSTLPLWEMKFGRLPSTWPKIATERIKWSEKIQKKYFIDTAAVAEINPEVRRRIAKQCKLASGALGLDGYVRMDMRVTNNGEIFFLEANPNPNIGEDEDFALSAKHSGVSYSQLLKWILRLAIQRQTSVLREDNAST